MSPTAGKRLHGLARNERVARQRLIGWRYIPAVAVYCTFSSMLILWLAWTTSASAAWFACGFAVGASLLFLSVATDSVAASRLESAAFAEQNTEAQIRKLRSLGWRVTSNVPFDKFDVDHVAIGPGGVFVLETKWSDGSLFDRKGHLSGYGTSALVQVNRNAERIATVLRQNGFDGGVTGTCVAVWGCEVPGNGRYDSAQPRGVLLRGELVGDHLRSAPIALDANEVQTAVDALDRFVSVRLRHIEQKTQPQGPWSKIGAN